MFFNGDAVFVCVCGCGCGVTQDVDEDGDNFCLFVYYYYLFEWINPIWVVWFECSGELFIFQSKYVFKGSLLITWLALEHVVVINWTNLVSWAIYEINWPRSLYSKNNYFVLGLPFELGSHVMERKVDNNLFAAWNHQNSAWSKNIWISTISAHQQIPDLRQ